MLTPKMKEDLCAQFLGASRQLFLSSRISEVCQEKDTQKQLEFILELMNEELTLRDENRRNRLVKRAGFPTYKTFEGYSCQSVKFPPCILQRRVKEIGVGSQEEESCTLWPVRRREDPYGDSCRYKSLQSRLKDEVLYGNGACAETGRDPKKRDAGETPPRDLRGLDLLILDEWGYVPVDKDGS